MRGGIDQHFLDLQIGIVADDFEGDAAEQAAGFFEHVRLVDDGQLATALHRLLAADADDPLGGFRRDHALKDCGLAVVFEALAPAVHALGVLAHDQQIDVARKCGTQIGEQVEVTAQRQDRAAITRDLGHRRLGRAEQDRVAGGADCECFRRQGIADALEGAESRVGGLDRDRQIQRFDHGAGGGDHLLPDAVAVDQGDREGLRIED